MHLRVECCDGRLAARVCEARGRLRRCDWLRRFRPAVRGSPSWQDYVEKMVRARTAANRAKVELEFIRMQHWEKTQDRADQRFEARLAP